MPAHRNQQASILDYIVVFHPKHRVQHMDQVILFKLAVGVYPYNRQSILRGSPLNTIISMGIKSSF